MKKTIIICIEGGFLREVHTNLPEDIEIEVKIMDTDSHKENPGGSEEAECKECGALLKTGSMRSIFEIY